jgi:primosomal replication protein N
MDDCRTILTRLRLCYCGISCLHGDRHAACDDGIDFWHSRFAILLTTSGWLAVLNRTFEHQPLTQALFCGAWKRAKTMAWTRITDPEQAVGPLPIWFGTRMIGLRGRFGLVLTSGEILRITSITALHQSPHGVILLDVLLDHAGVPEGVDQAWRTKHYLGAPVPGATMATVNLAHVVTAVEFVVAEIVEQPGEKGVLRRDELEPATAPPDSPPEYLARPTPEIAA